MTGEPGCEGGGSGSQAGKRRGDSGSVGTARRDRHTGRVRHAYMAMGYTVVGCIAMAYACMAYMIEVQVEEGLPMHVSVHMSMRLAMHIVTHMLVPRVHAYAFTHEHARLFAHAGTRVYT